MEAKEKATAATASLPPIPLIDLSPSVDSGAGSQEGPEACSPPPAEGPSLRWHVLFVLIGGGGDRAGGFLNFNPHPRSRWATLRDLDDDIHAGRCLGPAKEIEEGLCLTMDIFEIYVGCPVQIKVRVDEPVVCVDLSSKRGAAKLGGQFWVLADDDDDDESTTTSSMAEAIASTSLTMAMVPKSGDGQAAKSDDASPAHLRVVPKRPAAVPLLPWIGPLPKETMDFRNLISPNYEYKASICGATGRS